MGEYIEEAEHGNQLKILGIELIDSFEEVDEGSYDDAEDDEEWYLVIQIFQDAVEEVVDQNLAETHNFTASEAILLTKTKMLICCKQVYRYGQTTHDA